MMGCPRWIRLACAAAALTLLTLTTSAAPGQLARLRTITTPAAPAVHELADVDGDGRPDLVTIDRDGTVRLWRHADTATSLAAAGEPLALPDPRHALVTVADVLASGSGRQLVVAAPSGVSVWPATPGGGFAAEPVRVAGRASFDYRTGWPRRSDIAPDLNNDGRADLILPNYRRCQLWLNRDTDKGPRLERVGAFVIDVDRDWDTRAVHLSEELQEQFTLPALQTKDVNGDDRPDLVLGDEPVQSFHIQRPDGTLPMKPDAQLDLGRFRDTTPKPDSMIGGTATISDDAVSFSRDLDGDGIPDYVIAHRRKVWVFHGTPQGPQFDEPSKTFMVDEDITALLVIELNKDDRPDLLIFKVIVPSEAELLLGMLSPLKIEARVSGYANLDGRTFEATPSWQRDLEFRTPPIATMMRNPQRYVDQFMEVLSDVPTSRRGDFNGDGATDVIIIEPDPARLEMWFGAGEDDDEPDFDRLIREILFEEDERVWDLDRMLDLLRRVTDITTASITQDRPPDAVAELRVEDGLALREITTGDVSGPAGEEVLAIYESAGGGTEIDVYGGADGGR